LILDESPPQTPLRKLTAIPLSLNWNLRVLLLRERREGGKVKEG